MLPWNPGYMKRLYRRHMYPALARSSFEPIAPLVWPGRFRAGVAHPLRRMFSALGVEHDRRRRARVDYNGNRQVMSSQWVIRTTLVIFPIRNPKELRLNPSKAAVMG